MVDVSVLEDKVVEELSLVVALVVEVSLVVRVVDEEKVVVALTVVEELSVYEDDAVDVVMPSQMSSQYSYPSCSPLPPDDV